jgi:hypothetical protein
MYVGTKLSNRASVRKSTFMKLLLLIRPTLADDRNEAVQKGDRPDYNDFGGGSFALAVLNESD